MTKQNKKKFVFLFLICFLFIFFPLHFIEAGCCKESKGYLKECLEANPYICQETKEQFDCKIPNVWLGDGFCSNYDFCKEIGCCKQVIGNNINCNKKNRTECQNYCFFPKIECSQVMGCKEGLIAGCCVVEREGKTECVDGETLFRCPTAINPKKHFEAGKSCVNIPGCPQSLSGGEIKKQEIKPLDPLNFIPSVTIPGSEFQAGVAMPVSKDNMSDLLARYISAIFEFLVAVSAILAVLMIFFAGIKWMLAFGSSEKVGEAKKMIGNAILGLVLALATYTILSLINPHLVILKSLNITPIKRIELEFKSEKGASVGGWTGKNITTYDKILESAANKHNLDCTRLKAHMLIESGGNPNVVSWANACGLMQLLPTTAGKTCEELKNPEVNIFIAAQYYKSLQLNTCPKSTSIKRKSGQIEKVNCYPEKTECKNSSLKYVTAAYNGGLGANCSSANCLNQTFWECEKNLGYKETRDYVQKVNATYFLLKKKGWGC
jgi:hypothetical protein